MVDFFTPILLMHEELVYITGQLRRGALIREMAQTCRGSSNKYFIHTLMFLGFVGC
jgi:hypothetical protein